MLDDLKVGQTVWISRRLIANTGVGFDGKFIFPVFDTVRSVVIIGEAGTFWDHWQSHPNRQTYLPSVIFPTKEEAVENTLRLIAEERKVLLKRLADLDELYDKAKQTLSEQ